MPRRPTKARKTTRRLLPYELAYLTDDDAHIQGFNDFSLWCLRNGETGFDGTKGPRELWDEYRDEFLPAFIEKHPGKRPTPWWQWDAPRWNDPYVGHYYHGTLPDPRRRIGGIGTPCYEVLAYVPAFDKGIPSSWITPSEVAYYNGRVKFSDIPLLMPDHKEGDFKGVAVDPNDPPTFESEASYLDRNRLLTPGEKKKLKPEDFEPVTIAV